MEKVFIARLTVNPNREKACAIRWQRIKKTVRSGTAKSLLEAVPMVESAIPAHNQVKP